MNDILVSVFCMTYNQENYIRETIEGFLMQKTDFEYEILIHEDASTDKTAEILRYYEELYPDRIKVIYEKKNIYGTGIDYFFDILCPVAKGKYIAICEGDDAWIDEDKLQLQVDYMEKNPECSLIGHKAFLQYPGSWDKVRDNRSMGYRNEGIVDYESIFRKWEIPTSSFLFRRDTYLHMPDFYRNAPTGDEPLEFYLAEKGYIYFLNRVMSVYNKMTDDSWSVRFLNDGFDRMAKYYAGYIELFMNIDRYNGFKKHDFFEECIKERIRRALIYILFNTRSLNEVNSLLGQLEKETNYQWRDYITNQEKRFWFWNDKDSNPFWEKIQDKTVYIYGAGALATKFLNEIAPQDFNFEGMIISNGKKKPEKVGGLNIYYLSEIEETSFDNIFIIIAVVDEWAKEIKVNLEETGIYNYAWIYESVFQSAT